MSEANQIKDFYSSGLEKDRLDMELFKLEGIRTKEIIERYLKKDNLSIIDIGGGAGYYAFWLQDKGHHVTLVDLTPRNIELAEQYGKENGIQLEKAEVGDATKLSFTDKQFDMALLLGPLYHLTEKRDRVKALSEAKRVLKPGGILISAVISRYASLFDGFKRDLHNDPLFEKILNADLANGIHLNETGNMEYFTTAFFHTPHQIKDEIGESGLKFDKLIGVESFGWIVNGFAEKSKDDLYMKKLLHFIRLVESSDDLVAMSQHIIAVARKDTSTS